MAILDLRTPFRSSLRRPLHVLLLFFSVILTAQDDQPPAPEGLVVANSNSTSVLLLWQRGGIEAQTQYGVRYRTGTDDFGPWSVFVPNAWTFHFYHRVHSLEPGTAYDFELRRRGTAWGLIATLSASTTASLRPPAPPHFEAEGGEEQVFLTWGTEEGDSEVTGYEYRYDDGTGFVDWIPVSGTSPLGNAHTVSSIAAGEYTVELRAVNSVGAGAASAARAAVQERLRIPSAPEGLIVQNWGYNDANFLWNRGELSTEEKHAVRYRAGSGAFGSWEVFFPAAGPFLQFAHHVGSLAPGTDYHFEFRREGSGGWGAAASAHFTTISPWRAHSPSGFNATGGAMQVTLSWNPHGTSGSEIIYYEYRYNAGSGFLNWTRIPGSGPTTRSYTLSPLAVGSYTFELRSVTSQGPGWRAGGRTTGVFGGLPSLPTSLGTTRIPSPPAVVLGWDVVENDGGTPVTGYRARFRVSRPGGSGGNWKSWKSVSLPSFKVDNPYGGMEYTFQVRAVNAAGDGDVAEFVDLQPVVTPLAVDLSAKVPRGDVLRVNLRWLAPLHDGGSGITHYEMRWGESPAVGDWSRVPDVGPVAFIDSQRRGRSGFLWEFDDPTLIPGGEYAFELRAVSSAGAGASARIVVLVPLPSGGVFGSVAPPISPVGFRLGRALADAIVLEWDRDNSFAGKEHGIRYRKGSEPFGDWVVFVPGSWEFITHCWVGSLLQNTQYDFELRRKGPGGWSLASTLTASTRGAAVPYLPGYFTAEGGTSQVTLTWDTHGDRGSVITHYEYRYDDGTGYADWERIPGSNAHTRTYTISPLAAQDYYFELRAVNAVGKGEAGNRGVTVQDGLPSSPTALKVVRSSSGLDASLTWEEPASSGDSSITEYRVRYRAAKALTWATRGWTTWEVVSSRSLDVSHLVAGIEYTFQVQAVNGTGEGDIAVLVDAPPMEPPGATELNARVVSGTAVPVVSLRWLAPIHDGGSPITGYEIRWIPIGSSSGVWREFPIPDLLTYNDLPGWSSGFGIDFTDPTLRFGSQYRFELRAINLVGRSEISSAEVSLPVARERIRTPQTTPEPRGLTFVDSSWSSVHFLWSRDGLPERTQYSLRYRLLSGVFSQWESFFPTVTSLSFTHTVLSLGPDTDYEFELRRLGVGGWSAPSALMASTPPIQAPFSPSSLTAAVGNSQVTLSWDHHHDGGSPVMYYEYRQDDGTGYGAWIRIPGSDAATRYYTAAPVVAGSHVFEVRAVSATGLLGASSRVAVTVTAGGLALPPDELSASWDAVSGSVTLSWRPPSDTGSGSVTGYQVRLRRPGISTGSSDGWTAWMDVTSPSYDIGDLLAGLEYTFQVRAITDVAAGDIASLLSRSPAGPPLAAELSGEVSQVSSTPAVVLTWLVPEHDGGDGITGYEMRWSEEGGTLGSWEMVPSEELSAFTDGSRGGRSGFRWEFSDTSLEYGEGYRFELRARNSLGAGQISDVTVMVPAAVVPDLPSFPGGVNLVVDRHQVRVGWDRLGDLSEGITKYGLRYRTGSDMWSEWEILEAPAGGDSVPLAFTVTGLEVGTVYIFELRSGTATLWGGATEFTVRTLLNELPGAPGSLAATASSTQVVLTWEGPASGEVSVTGYAYRYDDGTGYTGWIVIPGSDADTRTWSVGSLTPETDYVFQVRALSSEGAGHASEEREIFTGINPPNAPLNLVAVASPTSVHLRWDAPWDGGSPIAGYQVRYSKGGGPWSSWQSTQETQFTISDLETGFLYGFEVRAHTDRDIGPASTRTALTIDTGVVRTLQVSRVDLARLRVSPNPFVEALTIQGREISGALLHSLDGKPVGRAAAQASVFSLDGSDLKAGVYFLVVFGDGWREVFRVIRE